MDADRIVPCRDYMGAGRSRGLARGRPSPPSWRGGSRPGSGPTCACRPSSPCCCGPCPGCRGPSRSNLSSRPAPRRAGDHRLRRVRGARRSPGRGPSPRAAREHGLPPQRAERQVVHRLRQGRRGRPSPPGWEAIDPCDPPHLFDPIHGLRFAIGGVSAAPPVPTRLFWGRERAGDLCWAGFCLELGPLDNLHEPIVARHGIDFTGGAVTAPPMPGVTLVYPYFQSKDPVEKIFSPLEIACLASQLGSAVPPSGSLIARSRRSTTSSTGLQAPGRPSWACTSWSR